MATWSRPDRWERGTALRDFLLHRLPLGTTVVQQAADGTVTRVESHNATREQLFKALREAVEEGGFDDVIPRGFLPSLGSDP